MFTTNELPISIAGASTLQIKLRAPSGTVTTKTATAVSGSNTSITYTTVAGDISEVGLWCLMGIVDDLSSEVEEFEAQ